MNSKLYFGEVLHHRSKPVTHTLKYPYLFCAIDLDELGKLDSSLSLFSYNKKNRLSIFDRDYLDRGASIKKSIMAFLDKEGYTNVKKILLVTAARYRNHVFNPVSFYYCYTADSKIACIAAEVNNTFGEKHLYIMQAKRDGSQKIHTGHKKEFHVSPFNNMKGEYLMSFTDPAETVDIQITLKRDEGIIMFARLHGEAMEFSDENIKTLTKDHPLLPWLSVPRIMMQAVILFFGKKLKYHPKGAPISRMTIGARTPGPFEKLYCFAFKKVFVGASEGSLRVIMPDRSEFVSGKKGAKRDASSPAALMEIHEWNAFKRFVRRGEIGFGEAYCEGEWTSPDLCAIFDFYLSNEKNLGLEKGLKRSLFHFFSSVTFAKLRNSRTQAKKNIHAHYDLGNDLFSAFLDRTMLYSSGIFKKENDSPEKSQLQKIHALIDKTGITKDDLVLEIGSGWGGFAIEAVKKTGCTIHTVTISQEQHDYVQRKVRELGLEKKIKVILKDYRELRGSYDVIISIEMLEAVGRQYYKSFFTQCEKLLGAQGRIGLQVITMPESRFNDYVRTIDWIQTYIFPGGFLPSLHELNKAVAKYTNMYIQHCENIGVHYAKTLRIWRDTFNRNTQKIMAFGYDERFMRMWDYYLAICEAGFENRILNDMQIVLSRPGNRRLPVPHLDY